MSAVAFTTPSISPFRVPVTLTSAPLVSVAVLVAAMLDKSPIFDTRVLATASETVAERFNVVPAELEKENVVVLLPKKPWPDVMLAPVVKLKNCEALMICRPLPVVVGLSVVRYKLLPSKSTLPPVSVVSAGPVRNFKGASEAVPPSLTLEMMKFLSAQLLQ